MNKTRLENIFAELVVVLLLRNKESIKLVKELYDEILNYKNIEDELGIDLATLFKAMKQNSLFYRNEANEIKQCQWCRMGFQEPCFMFMYDGFGSDVKCCNIVNPEDYGKTWALTEEELL